MTQASLSLSTLPPEILCQVFQSLLDFTSISALTQTAHIFYRIWLENPTSICSSVAPRVIWNLGDAWRLVDAQESASTIPSPGGQDQNLSRAKRLLFNARCAAAACEHWIDVVKIQNNHDRGQHLGEDPNMRPSERARFEHAFYSVWTIGMLGSMPHLHSQAEEFVNGVSPHELFRLLEMETWASNFNENDFRERLGLDLNLDDAAWKAAYKLISERWRSASRGNWSCSGPPHSNLGFFVFEDPYQENLERIPDHW